MRAILPSNLSIGSLSVRHRQFATTGFPKDALPDSHVFLEKDDGAPTHSPWGGRWIGAPELVESAASRSIAARIGWRVAALAALPVGQGLRPDWGTERPPRRRRPRAGGSRLPVH